VIAMPLVFPYGRGFFVLYQPGWDIKKASRINMQPA